MTRDLARTALGAKTILSLIVLCAGTILITQVVGIPGVRSGDASQHLRFYVVVPSDVELNYGLADAARHETDLAIGWLERQTGGALRRGPDFAQIIHLPRPEASLRGTPYLELLAAAEAEAPDDAFPVVLADVRTTGEHDDWWVCGQGGPEGLVVYMRNCRTTPMSTTATWGSPTSVILAHELLHGMFAVAPCAPNATPDGHVDDAQLDIMSAVLDPHPDGALVLDVGRDDYFGHGDPECPDIMDSPLWE